MSKLRTNNASLKNNGFDNFESEKTFRLYCGNFNFQ